MDHSAEQHLEHAEHAQHAAHDPLSRRIAMTMAIIAAVLAAAGMISHRGHTQTLRLTNEANIRHTQSSDQWGFYQAKKIRTHEYQAFAQLMDVLQPRPGAEDKQKKALGSWRSQVERYEGAKGGHGGELAQIKHQAEHLHEEGEGLEKASAGVHHSVNWIDYGHLGLEFALVLCSIAVLTRQRGFWYTGMGSAGIGLVLVLVGVAGLLEHGHL